MAVPVSLAQLIAAVDQRATERSAIDRVSVAVAAAHEVAGLADALVGHYVDQARQAGHSWSQIGEALGVSKQAVHQKFTAHWAAPDLTRFTPRARHALDEAQAAARRLK